MKKIEENLGKYLVLAVLAAGLGVFLWQAVTGGSRDAGQAVAVAVPQFSPAASAGKEAFDAVCATCHGANGAGTEKGPPLVHNIYNPGHHGDAAFYLAAKRGVRQHHWSFGDMPPQPHVSDEEIAGIVQYVRELQQANGILWQEHRM